MFVGNLRKLKNLKAHRHFRFDATTPGVVYTKVASDATEESVDLLVIRDWAPSQSTLPPLVPLNGLSQERQRYRHDTIREYCLEEVRDRVCPRPTNVRPLLYISDSFLLWSVTFLLDFLWSAAFLLNLLWAATGQEGSAVQQVQRARPYRKMSCNK